MKNIYKLFLKAVIFLFISFTFLNKVSAQSTVTIPGSFQNEVGCPGDWMPDCAITALTYNSSSGKWEGSFTIPAGCWFYKVTINGSWGENYGLNGVPGGSDIPLTLSSPMLVTFTYDPVTHIVSTPYDYPCFPPSTIVVASSFQSELGCLQDQVPVGGDWEPGCDNTRLTYDPDSKLWVGTFNIPPGYWEFKFAYNNSWSESYGLNGGNANIPLDLCIASQVTFKYNIVTRLAVLEFNPTAICITKFYDVNLNGINDEGIPLENVQFTLSGNSNAVQYTGSDGKTTFTGLTAGNYTVTETLLPDWAPTTPATQTITLNAPAKLSFGNVCLGGGGGHGIGYWMSKSGQEKLTNMGMEYELWWLRILSLRNADGSDFDPFTYTDFKSWLQKANAKNMTYMLSAQMAAMFLNLDAGYVSYSSIVYTPGCGNYWVNNNFSYISSLAWDANYYLFYLPGSLAKDPYRATLECFKNGLDKANNNLNFVQSYPCNSNTETVSKRSENLDLSVAASTGDTRIWPNPTSNHFTLRAADLGTNKAIRIKVFDVNGRQVYTTTGSATKDYYFGEKFVPGIYLLEVIQGNTRKTFKLIKQ